MVTSSKIFIYYNQLVRLGRRGNLFADLSRVVTVGSREVGKSYRGVATAGDTGDTSPVRPIMSPLHQNDNRQFVFGADFDE